MKIRSMLVATVAMLAVVGCKEQAGTDAAGKAGAEPKEKVEFTMHVMAQCPFGVQVENGFKPVLDKLGKAVDFKVYFIGDEATPGQLTSMHGDNEIKGDLLQVCTMKNAPDKWMDVIICMNKNARDIPTNFDACATEVKADGAKIHACADGDEGKALLSASFKVSKDKGARGSPTMFLAGAKYEGGRTENDFIRAICGKFATAKPEVCKNIPEPKKIDVVVLSDARCKDCAPDRIVGQLKNMFPGLQPKTVDYGTPEGKALYDGLKDKGAKLLPAFLFAPIVAEDPGFQQVQRFVADAGEYKLLQIGAKFDPTAEICDNQIDDDGNGKIDCADDACKGKVVCREAKAKQLDVFVMAQCPFGVKALNAMKEVLDAFKDDSIAFNINYIADELPDGSFKSLHGQGEVDEDIRELCVIKNYPKGAKYMDYVLCRNADIRATEWQKCATGGIDAKVIDKCASGPEGKKLLSENLKLAKDLGIGASPTWLANNKNQFSGVAAEQIKKNFCAYNADLKGCAKTLSGDAKGPAGGCGAN